MEEKNDQIKPESRKIKAEHDMRHSLAIDRTTLANERTLLSYTRTSLTLFVPGVSFLHFTDAVSFHIIGFVFIPFGFFTFFYGYYRFLKKKTVIKKERYMLDQMLKNEYCKMD